MLYLRSINRFILISLALLGLSVSSANAGVVWDNGGPDDDAYLFFFSQSFDITDDFELSSTTTVTDIDVWLFKNIASDFDDIFVNIGGVSASILGKTETFVENNPIDGGPDGASYKVNIDIVDITLGSGVHKLELGDGSDLFGTGWMMTQSFQLNRPLRNGAEPAELLPDAAFMISGNVDDDVGAVPVPATIWLFGTALIGLVGFTKRQSTVTV